jgi:hypothetical protein
MHAQDRGNVRIASEKVGGNIITGTGGARIGMFIGFNWITFYRNIRSK